MWHIRNDSPIAGTYMISHDLIVTVSFFLPPYAWREKSKTNWNELESNQGPLRPLYPLDHDTLGRNLCSYEYHSCHSASWKSSIVGGATFCWNGSSLKMFLQRRPIVSRDSTWSWSWRRRQKLLKSDPIKQKKHVSRSFVEFIHLLLQHLFWRFLNSRVRVLVLFEQ